MSRVLSWFSCGAASAVATKLTPEAIPVYCETGAEHPDNERFLKDCEEWFERPVTRLKSEKYANTWDVWEKRKYIAGVKGAPCTVELKVVPRVEFQHVDDLHLFGYTADSGDVRRAERFKKHFFELTARFPLIERGLTKAACLEMVERAGIKLPVTYAMGFPNANCIPCGKAKSPAYYALCRLYFPEEFNRLAELCRKVGARLAELNGERIFIDEIPEDHPVTQPIAPSCDFLCAIAEKDL